MEPFVFLSPRNSIFHTYKGNVKFHTGLFFAFAAAALALGAVYWTHRRGQAILKKWAEEEGVHIVTFERVFFSGGFSAFSTSRNQVVYSIVVRDQNGRERKGWVRCGSFWNGVWGSDEAEVKWAED